MCQTDHDMLIQMNTKLDVLVTRGEDHEGRIRGIERKIYVMGGAATALGAVLGAASDYLTGQ